MFLVDGRRICKDNSLDQLNRAISATLRMGQTTLQCRDFGGSSVPAVDITLHGQRCENEEHRCEIEEHSRATEKFF